MPASQLDDPDDGLVPNNKNVFNKNKNVFIVQCAMKGGFALVGKWRVWAMKRLPVEKSTL
jgi:hypothetical protein